eukprot:1264249-Amphidinium_carterae.1
MDSRLTLFKMCTTLPSTLLKHKNLKKISRSWKGILAFYHLKKMNDPSFSRIFNNLLCNYLPSLALDLIQEIQKIRELISQGDLLLNHLAPALSTRLAVQTFLMVRDSMNMTRSTGAVVGIVPTSLPPNMSLITIPHSWVDL